MTISEALKTAGIKHTISLDGSSITVEDDYLTARRRAPSSTSKATQVATRSTRTDYWRRSMNQKTWQESFGLVKDMYGVWHGSKAQVESFAELTRTPVYDGCAVYQGETYYFAAGAQ